MARSTVFYGNREISWAARPLEKVVQKQCSVLLRLAGFTVGSTSQYRASHQAEGIPDLHLFHEKLCCSGWWETKRPGDDLSPKQVTWRERCLATRTLHGWGTDEDLQRWLVELGLGKQDGLVFGILQPSKWPNGRADPISTMARIVDASKLHHQQGYLLKMGTA